MREIPPQRVTRSPAWAARVAAAIPVLLFPVAAFAQRAITPSDRPEVAVHETDLRVAVVRIVNYALSFVGLIAVAAFIVAGFQYLLSAGVPERVKRAKRMLEETVTGLAIILLSYVIVNAVIALGRVIDGEDIALPLG